MYSGDKNVHSGRKQKPTIIIYYSNDSLIYALFRSLVWNGFCDFFLIALYWTKGNLCPIIGWLRLIFKLVIPNNNNDFHQLLPLLFQVDIANEAVQCAFDVLVALN